MIKRLLRETGFSYFPIAFIARFPYAMMVVGVLTLAVSARGSLFIGGITSALVGVGTAIFGPYIGAMADRHGQRATLLIVGTLNAVVLALFVWFAVGPFPVWVMFIGAFMIGAFAPQISSMSRARLMNTVQTRVPAAERGKTLGSVMAYESTADETVFVFGPFLVGVLAVAFGAGSPLIVASALTAIFVISFALHPTAVTKLSDGEAVREIAPVKELLNAKLLIVVAGTFGIGTFFGSSLTSLTAFMKDLGSPEKTGVLYGVMGLGSAVLALSVAFFPPAFKKRNRWVLFAAVMLVGGIVLLFANTEKTIMMALLVLGLGVGPLLVTFFSFGADRSPVGRSATVMTTLSSAIVVGQALSAALTGWIAEEAGSRASFFVPLGAIIVIVLTGITNWFLTPHSEH